MQVSGSSCLYIDAVSNPEAEPGCNHGFSRGPLLQSLLESDQVPAQYVELCFSVIHLSDHFENPLHHILIGPTGIPGWVPPAGPEHAVFYDVLDEVHLWSELKEIHATIHCLRSETSISPQKKVAQSIHLLPLFIAQEQSCVHDQAAEAVCNPCDSSQTSPGMLRHLLLQSMCHPGQEDARIIGRTFKLWTLVALPAQSTFRQFFDRHLFAMFSRMQLHSFQSLFQSNLYGASRKVGAVGHHNFQTSSQQVSSNPQMETVHPIDADHSVCKARDQ